MIDNSEEKKNIYIYVCMKSVKPVSNLIRLNGILPGTRIYIISLYKRFTGFAVHSVEVFLMKIIVIIIINEFFGIYLAGSVFREGG